MINETYARRYCCEDISKIENYDKAVNDSETWECHHKGEVLPCGMYSVEDLKEFNLYWQRPASELIFLTKKDHKGLHRGILNCTENHRRKVSRALKGKKKSAEHRANISKGKKGKPFPAARIFNKGNNHRLGSHHTEETKMKMSETLSKKRWWKNGNDCVFREEPPDNTWTRGRIISWRFCRCEKW